MIDVESTTITLIEQNGYKYDRAKDNELLTLCINRANQTILNELNVVDLPTELVYVLATRSAGEFLQTKFAIGATFENADIPQDGDIKGVREGDTEVTKFDGNSPTDKLKKRIADLRVYGQGEISRFRCLKW